MEKEQTAQKHQAPFTLPDLPPVATILLPIVGIPLALHAVSGAAVALFTFAFGSQALGITKEKILDSAEEGLNKRLNKRPAASETTL